MAKTVAPLLGFGASGQIGSSHVYSTWRGIKYARRYVIPGNPKTAGQSLTRNTFTSLNEIYKLAPALVTPPWEAATKGKPLTARNAFVKSNLANLRSEILLTDFTFSGGALGGLPPVSVIATPAATTITLAFTNPTPPVGWTLTAAVGAAILDQNPQAPTDLSSFADDDTVTMNSVVITGLVTATDYVVGGWLVWTKPDGTLAYSPATMQTVTTA